MRRLQLKMIETKNSKQTRFLFINVHQGTNSSVRVENHDQEWSDNAPSTLGQFPS